MTPAPGRQGTTSQGTASHYKLTYCIQLLLVLLLSTYISTTHAAPGRAKANSPTFKIDIIINGIDGDLKKNVLAWLELRKSLNNPHFSLSWLKKLHKKADKNITDALQPFGYYQVKINSNLEHISDKHWRTIYTIQPGEPVKIAAVNITISKPGKDDPDVMAVISHFPIHQGSQLNHQQYENAKDRLISDIGQLGYSQIKNQSSRVIIDPQSNTAQIRIHLQSGKKYRLGEFFFNQDFLHDDFVKSYIQDIKTGDPHSQENLLSLQDSLLSSGYFSVVDIKPDYSRAKEQHVPVEINLKPAKRHRFTAGIGYDTEIAANISFRWQHRRINRWGHNSDVISKLSAKKSLLQGTYWIPTGNPHTDKISIISRFETENTDTTDRDTFDLETGYWFTWRDWNSTLFSEYKYEQFVSGNDAKTTTELLSLGVRGETITFEKALYPRNGWSLLGELRVASEALMSDIDYFRLYLKSRLLVPITDNGRLILRGEYGMAETSDFDLYPSSLRFYAGGDHSVRGYKWKALGPKDSDGNVIGGRNVITASIEYNHKIAEKWLLAGFLDAGNAYNDKLLKVYSGAGFGTRWIAPFGLVRADLGFPLDSDDDIAEDNFVFYFGFEVTL